jgi:hypothetical protein
MFEIENIQKLSTELGVDILAKVIFSFGPNIILSPLSLPRHLLHTRIDSLVKDLPPGALRDVLLQLKNRPTFEEQWPDTWQEGLVQGKRRVLQLEKIRKDTYTLENILEKDPEIHAWYQAIAC